MPSSRSTPRRPFFQLLVHGCGIVGAAVVAGLVLSPAVSPPEEFPSSFVGGFHGLWAGFVRAPGGLPAEHTPEWRERIRPGDVLFMSRGRAAWGLWTHVAVVVSAPPNDDGIPVGALALVDSSIHDGVHLVALDTYADWPRVVLRRPAPDASLGVQIANAALEQRERIFAFSAMVGDPLTSCANVAIASMEAAGIDVGVGRWQTPDVFFRAPFWDVGS